MSKKIAKIGGENGMCGIIIVKTTTEWQPIVHLYNTWMHHYIKQTIDPYCLRYNGIWHENLWQNDVQSLGKKIVETINAKITPTKKQKDFIKKIKSSSPFPWSIIYYKTPVGYYFDETTIPTHPESSFMLMMKLFNVPCMRKKFEHDLFMANLTIFTKKAIDGSLTNEEGNRINIPASIKKLTKQ